MRGPKPKLTEYACPNERCGFYGQAGKGNVVGNGSYGTKSGRVRKLICHSCGTVFCSREGTAFYDLRTDLDTVVLAISMLLKGMSLRGVAEVLDVKLDTVRGWLQRAAEHAESINDILVRRLKVSRVELDELWSFVKKKQLSEWQKSRQGTGGSGRRSHRRPGSSSRSSSDRVTRARRES